MLRIILLSLVWAICSTCLVRPWFWKGVKNKYLFNDGTRIGFPNNSWKSYVAIEIVLFVLMFLFSIGSYAIVGCRQNLYGSFILVIMCCIAQCVWEHQGKVRYSIFIIIAVISAVLWIQDGIVGSSIRVPFNKVTTVTLTQYDENTEVKSFISSNEVQNLFKVTSASGPTYNNGKYIFTVDGGDTGKGVVIIDKGNYEQAKFLSCEYGFRLDDVKYLRSQYPTQKLRSLYITISDDNDVYELFSVSDKEWIFGTYHVKGYILFNLITGEQEFMQEEELPIFVTKN